MNQPEQTIANIYKAARNYGVVITRLDPSPGQVMVWCDKGGVPFNFVETCGASDATDITLTMGEKYMRAKGIIVAGVKI